jgi:hypothetical protein
MAEVPMNAFIVELENKPGEVARIAEAIANKGINITSATGSTAGDKGGFGLMTNDEAGTRSALKDLKCSYREVEVVPASIADQPGALAKAARRLADAGVNVDLILPTGMSGGKVTVAFAVDKPDVARRALGELAAAMA